MKNIFVFFVLGVIAARRVDRFIDWLWRLFVKHVWSRIWEAFGPKLGGKLWWIVQLVQNRVSFSGLPK